MLNLARAASIFAFLFLSTTAFAAPLKGPGYEFQDDRSLPTIVYLNGINNTEAMAAQSSEALITTLKQSGLPEGKYNFRYFYNLGDTLLQDSAEALAQAKISSDIKKTYGSSAYYQKLGEHYNQKYASLNSSTGVDYAIYSVAGFLRDRLTSILSKSRSVVLVAHSQGNFYIEASYAMLIASGRSDLADRIRIVGVAAAAATTPNNRYITHDQDKVIADWLVKVSTYASTIFTDYIPLPAQVTACRYEYSFLHCGAEINWATLVESFSWAFSNSKLKHSFVDVYLNIALFDNNESTRKTFPLVVYKYVRDSLSELDSAQLYPPPSNWPTTCNGQSTVMASWTRFGTASYNQATNTYSVGDRIVSDRNDADGDCNQVDNWNSATGQDNDWMFYNRAATGDIDFSAQSCITPSSSSGHFVGLYPIDPAFTGAPRSGHNPVGEQQASVFTMWNQPGKLMYSIGGSGGVVGFIQNVPVTANGYCATYRFTREGGLYSLYVNGSFVASRTASTAPIVPGVVAYDNVVTLTPTVIFGTGN